MCLCEKKNHENIVGNIFVSMNLSQYRENKMYLTGFMKSFDIHKDRGIFIIMQLNNPESIRYYIHANLHIFKIVYNFVENRLDHI